jgi:hypothetical protein
MTAKSARLSLLGALIVGAGTFANPVDGATTAQSATGSGQYEFKSDSGAKALRTFAFEASKASDGTVRGQAQVKNRATGQALHIRIDCLNIIGNIAVMSGTAVSATGPQNSDGDAEIFAVEDNGQGVNAGPDLTTRAFGNSGFVCTDVTPANVGDFTDLLNEVEDGTIQIQ